MQSLQKSTILTAESDTELSASHGEDLFIRHEGHFEFHFRLVLLRMINSGRRPPLRRFRAPYSNEMPETRPVEKSLAKFIRCAHVERMHISLYECQRNRQSPPSHGLERNYKTRELLVIRESLVN